MYEHTALFLLRPRGPLRFGRHPDDLGAVSAFPCSDTLFGALVWTVELTRGQAQVAEWVAAFASGKPPFLMSSAFPYDDETGTAFVPRPQRRREGEGETSGDRKLMKRVEFVDVRLVPWFAGKEMAVATWGTFCLGPPEIARRLKGRVPWEIETVPGVAVDRISSASQVYSVSVTRYSCSLAVYVAAQTAEPLDEIEELFDVLCHLGIGGRRSRGAGWFTLERRRCDLPLTPWPSGMSLSLIWPRPDELEAGALSPPGGLGYRIVERGGWISSPSWASERCRTVAMLGEGSYVSPHLEPPIGGMPDVTPANASGRHRVYRYGYGLFLDEERLS